MSFVSLRKCRQLLVSWVRDIVQHNPTLSSRPHILTLPICKPTSKYGGYNSTSSLRSCSTQIWKFAGLLMLLRLVYLLILMPLCNTPSLMMDFLQYMIRQ